MFEHYLRENIIGVDEPVKLQLILLILDNSQIN